MRLIVCTDLDGTLFPNGPAPESPGAAARLRRLVTLGDVTLVFVTGRDPRRTEQAMEEHRLPAPDFVISDVGATLSAVRRGSWEISRAWRDALRDDWPDGARERLRESLAGVAGLREQETDRQSEFKLSYYAPAHENENDLLEQVLARADRSNVETKLIWSVEPDGSRGLLDALPRRASKLGAIQHLLSEHEFDRDRVVYAGDSGNDLDVLTSSVPAVLVANATDDVRRRALRESERRGTTPFLYLARGGFLGMNGNYAAGVLEGIAHFHAEIGPWLEESA